MRGIMRINARQSGSTLVACSLVLLGVALLSSATLRSVEDGTGVSLNAIDRRLAEQAAEAALHDAAMTLTMSPEQFAAAMALGPHRFGDITGERYPHGGQFQACAPPDYVLELLTQPELTNQASDGGMAPAVYRVTAHGKGRSELTTVTLQADFALHRCTAGSDASPSGVQQLMQVAEQDALQSKSAQNNIVQSTAQSTARSTTQTAAQSTAQDSGLNPAQSTTPGPVQESSPPTEAKPTPCLPGVRRLAWRLLPAS